MSRIQQILDKAERDGATLRTHRLATTMEREAIADRSLEPPSIHETARAIDNRQAERTVESAALHSERSAEGLALHAPEAPEAPKAPPFVRLNPLLVAGLAPKSLAAEQYRQLRTRLSLAEGANAVRTVLITSPQKGEGKSITSANLALTMAQELQRRVVLVEADLRKPSLQQLFGLPAGPGLSDFLTGAADLAQVMKTLPDHHLTVIPAGSTPANPAELLGSTAMRRLLDQLRTTFDRVILDTPPVLPLADVAILAPIVDGALMVVRAGYTPKPAIENALRAFDSSRLLGVVLNESGLEEDYRYESVKN